MMNYVKCREGMDIHPVDAAYACYNKDETVRAASTSGGVFSSIAAYVIGELGGVVFGACFDKQFNIQHVEIDELGQIDLLRGSKYPQSNLGSSFRRVKEILRQGRIVLFTGSPCQVAGLVSFLGEKPAGLLLMDFVCHGVASPGVWRGYLDEMEDSSTITRITFKHKIKGWKKWHFMIERGDERKYVRGSMNPFMRSYLQYSNVRPSCYSCRFKGLSRESDFTISDCWGVGERNENLNDDRGLSALLIRGIWAKEIFEAISHDIEYQEYDAEVLMSGNWTAESSVPINADRAAFFDSYAKHGTRTALEKYYSPTALSWLQYYLKRLKGVER